MFVTVYIDHPFSSELLLLHRLLFEELSQLPSLPEAVQVDKLLELLERTFSAFSLYTSFMDNIRPQAVQVTSSSISFRLRTVYSRAYAFSCVYSVSHMGSFLPVQCCIVVHTHLISMVTIDLFVGV